MPPRSWPGALGKSAFFAGTGRLESGRARIGAGLQPHAMRRGPGMRPADSHQARQSRLTCRDKVRQGLSWTVSDAQNEPSACFTSITPKISGLRAYLKRSPLRTVIARDKLVAFGHFLRAVCGQISRPTVHAMTDLGEAGRPTLAVQPQPTRARSCRGIARSFLRPQCRAGKIPVHAPLGCRTRAD